MFNPGMTIGSDTAASRVAQSKIPAIKSATTPIRSVAIDSSFGGISKVGIPTSNTTGAVGDEVASVPQPAYHGPAVNSITHVAHALGATYSTDPSTGMVNVNGTSVRPTTIVNGVSHAPVTTTAQAAGYPATHIQVGGDGTVQIMPHAPVDSSIGGMSKAGVPVSTQTQPVQPHPTAHPSPQQSLAPFQLLNNFVNHPSTATIPQQGLANTSASLAANAGSALTHPTSAPPVSSPNGAGSPQTSQTTNTTLNPYWQKVQSDKGLWQTNLGDISKNDFVNQLASKFRIEPSQIQYDANTKHAFIPFQALQNYAAQQSAQGSLQNALGNAQGTIGTDTGGSYDQTVQSLLTSLLTALQGQQAMNPYASQIAGLQQPQFNVDPNQLMQQAYQMENPVYQNQIASQNQIINDQMNKRGFYNSGLAQQAINSEDAALNQNMDNAMMKDYNNLYSQQQNDYKNQLQAYMDQVNALHDSGELSDTQFGQIVNGIRDALTASTAQQNANTSGAKLTDAQLNQAGYAIDPNGNYVPTVNATKDQVAAMQNWAKIMGYTVNPDGSISPTLQALNQGGTTIGANGTTTQTVAAQNDAFNQWFKTQQLNDTTQQNAFKDWATQQGVAQKWQSLTDAEKKQAFNQWYQTQGLQLKQNENSFNQWLKTSQLKTTQDQNNFKDWATKQGVLQKWQSLTDAEKKAAVQQYQNQEKINISQENANTSRSKEITANQISEQKLRDAESNQAFKQWATKQGIQQKWQSLSDAEKKQAVAQYQNQEKINISQQNANTSQSKAATAAQQGQERINIEQQNADTAAKKAAATAANQQNSLNERIRHDQATESATLTKAQQTGYYNYVTKTTTQLNDTINQARQVLQNAASYSPGEVNAAHQTLQQSMTQLQDLTVAPASPQVAQYAQQHPGTSVAQLNAAWNEAQAAKSAASSKSSSKPGTTKKK